jgi:hypothetical protein
LKAVPWLALSPIQARVVLVDLGTGQPGHPQKMLELCGANDFGVVKIAAGLDLSATAQKLAGALALPPTHTFPVIA